MGSAVVALSRNDFLNYPVPPLTRVREKIVTLLDAIDEKIELHRQMNDTLEVMARAIFKDWFVDFGPTRAKLDGRKTSLHPQIAQHFPSELEPSLLGLVPKGWRVDNIYSISDVIYGAPFSSKLFNEDGVGTPLVRIRDLPKEAPEVFTTEAHPKGYLVTQGDIVVGMDGEFRTYLWGGADGWLNQRVCVLKPKDPVPRAFVLNSIAPLLAQVEATETATTVIHLGKNDIDRFRVTVPSTKVLRAFSDVSEPLVSRIVANKIEPRIAVSLRNILLPKLISGGICAKDTERIAEAAQ